MAHAKAARWLAGRTVTEREMTVQNIKRFVEHVKMDHEERLQDIRIQMKSLPPGDLIFARKNQKVAIVSRKLNDQRFGITEISSWCGAGAEAACRKSGMLCGQSENPG